MSETIDHLAVRAEERTEYDAYNFCNPELGEVLGPEAETLGAIFRPAQPEPTEEEFLVSQSAPMGSKQISEHLENIKSNSAFKEDGGRIQHIPGFGKFTHMTGGIIQKYSDTLQKQEKKSGKNEAATYGEATFGDEKCILFAMNWDFIGGSVGVVAGEKLLAAAQLAKRQGIPLVKVYSTGGMRQQENFLALTQMHRGVAAIDRYSKDTDTPQVAVLLGQVWGGTSASTVPLADTVIGVAGSNFGFAGPKVIGAFTGVIPPKGSQSVEANYLNRYVDVVVEQNELNDYLATYLKVGKSKEKIPKSQRVSDEDQSIQWETNHRPNAPRTIVYGEQGFAPALFENQFKASISKKSVEFPSPQPVDPYDTSSAKLYENYNLILKDAGRPDGEFFIKNIFDNAVPLYNHYVKGNTIVYPPIISALTRINNQPFLVIANQPSYIVRSDGSIRKLLSTPRPEDYERVESLMEMAERRGIPVVSFTDTPGAAPTTESEKRGQSTRIARSIRSFIRHSKPVISVVTGGLGSGGGIATTAISPELIALDYAQLWVAEPGSATSILQKTDNPTKEQIEDLLTNFQCTPLEIKKLGVPIKIVQTSTDPIVIARNLRAAILESYEWQSDMRDSKLAIEKRKRLYRIGHKAIQMTKAHHTRVVNSEDEVIAD